ncbi:MAG: sugar phosphate isomerase/epimerase [Verrucomicrobia bacterium]|nr:sugar phosphate isomerase/epimerase [Verrucomicrobiota bacterium]
MKLCVVSESLGHLSYQDAAKASAGLGIAALEIGMGNWCAAPHADLRSLLESKDERRKFLSVLEQNGLALAALNCSGNQLHPVEGKRHSEVVYDTVRVAELLGVDSIVLMSGLPAGGPNDVRPNWVTCAWPLENGEMLDWQWNDQLLPYWQKLAAFGREHGIKKFCIEMHGNQLVYNVPTLLRLRKEIGPIVGANLDPSHLFWMGADPLAAVDALGDAIHHVHAKDTFLNEAVMDLTGRLETLGHGNVKGRAWNYITLGYGHGDQWWRAFCYRLRLNGYDGWLSIEHEDIVLSRMEGLRKSVELLKHALIDEPGDYAMPAT